MSGAVGGIVGLIVVAFSLRRLLFLVASFLPARPCRPSRAPSVAVLVSARDEQSSLPRFLAALGHLDYPRERLSVVLVNDGSTDATGRLVRDGENRLRALGLVARALELEQPHGKPRALERALRVAPPSDLVVVFDADAEPAPDAVAWLAGAFDDPSVDVASGYARPRLAVRGWVARYAAIERWVHQLVLLAGKDRLGWNPPAVGAICAFRRAVLEARGGFPAGSLADDVALSHALTGAGSRSRWIRQAVADETVAADLPAFVAQRRRWGVGLAQTTRFAKGFEARFVSAGYVDRLALVASACLAPIEPVLVGVIALFGAASLASTCVAVTRSDEGRILSSLAALVIVFPFDVLVSVGTVFAVAVGLPRTWIPRRAAGLKGDSGDG